MLAVIDAVLTTGDLAPQQDLLGVVEGLCREAGLGDVFDHWGDDYPWMKTYRPD